VDAEIAHRWGIVVAQAAAAGRPVGVMDAFVAATAMVHGLTLVTRNVSDFQVTGIPMVNPWSE